MEERLIEQIIASTPLADYQKELLSKDEEYSLEDAIKLGRTYEASVSHIKQLQQMETPQMVHGIRTKNYQKCRNYGGTIVFGMTRFHTYLYGRQLMRRNLKQLTWTSEWTMSSSAQIV